MLLALPAAGAGRLQGQCARLPPVRRGPAPALRQARRGHQLPHLVVLALGADASVTGGQIQQAKKILGPKRKLGLVTPARAGRRRVERRQGDPQRRPARPEHIKVLDWVHYSAGHGSWFQPDGLHLTFCGAKALRAAAEEADPARLTASPSTAATKTAAESTARAETALAAPRAAPERESPRRPGAPV